MIYIDYVLNVAVYMITYKTILEKCTDICGGCPYWELDKSSRPTIGKSLAKYLLEIGFVNVVWPCRLHEGLTLRDTIISYLCYLDTDLVCDLFTEGLDLNLLVHNGVAALTWMIGNAENDWVSYLLRLSSKHQNLTQRLSWINKTDQMSCVQESEQWCLWGLFRWDAKLTISRVEHTALQLAILKGYKDVDGLGGHIHTSNVALARQLLELGADRAIDYQEPTNGNSVLHFAYARRDLAAIDLLESYGASKDIENRKGKKPSHMLKLSYDKVSSLLRTHTSPDGHPDTFLLDEDTFNSADNLAAIKERFAPQSEREYSLISIAPH